MIIILHKMDILKKGIVLMKPDSSLSIVIDEQNNFISQPRLPYNEITVCGNNKIVIVAMKILQQIMDDHMLSNASIYYFKNEDTLIVIHLNAYCSIEIITTYKSLSSKSRTFFEVDTSTNTKIHTFIMTPILGTRRELFTGKFKVPMTINNVSLYSPWFILYDTIQHLTERIKNAVESNF